jgi:7-cyano-7-deazaguanine synthase
MEEEKVVMGLSGGMDSATLLGILVSQGYAVHCCSFYYGSKHNKYELEAANNLVKFYQDHQRNVVHHKIDLSVAFSEFKSNLLLTGGEIPEGHYEAESMKATVVPGRNMIFAAIMAGLAESIGAVAIALGVHQGDHHIYPDCRKEFIKALDLAVYLSSDRKIEVITPLLEMNKISLLRRGLHVQIPAPIPYHLTRTCYKDQELSCGKCGSCQERLEAFELNGIKDPIKYE